MNDTRISIDSDQREQIAKALGAIGRRVGDMVNRPTTQADLFVIWTNLMIIQTNVSAVPRISTNLPGLPRRT
jgi:hypothetical protein